jgi:energy-coupling factor transport system permease protein
VSVAVVIALTVAPQLVQSAIRVRRARRLRGGRVTGLRAVRALAIPVLEDAVDRSLALAAAMEVRGYGRTRSGGRRGAQPAGSFMVAALGLLAMGSYLLLSGQVVPCCSERPVPPPGWR